ncbi:hypothetical protein KPH14_007242 [Odynerus spinipes]|uniref:Profilin n=1 Tax=Odynerus spinipes TaxID=1348599 RepID=A0AAD9VJC9_9HYME|nr:hypothetical protein KPH14_007242 [Odynerus spinipes]
MSWQDYVDKQLLASRCVTKAAIAGHDGNLWAKSEGFEVSKEELAKLVQGFAEQDILTSSGVTLAGNRRRKPWSSPSMRTPYSHSKPRLSLKNSATTSCPAAISNLWDPTQISNINNKRYSRLF